MALFEQDEAVLTRAVERRLITRRQHQTLVSELEMSGAKGAAGRLMVTKGYITPEQRIELENAVSGIPSGAPAFTPQSFPGAPFPAPAFPQPSLPAAPAPGPVLASPPVSGVAPPGGAVSPGGVWASPSAFAPVPPHSAISPLSAAAAFRAVSTSGIWQMSGDSPVGSVLLAARSAGATDFHWAESAGSSVRIRGTVVPWSGPQLSVLDARREFPTSLPPEALAEWRRCGTALEVATLPDGGRVRLSIQQTGSGLSFSARLLPSHPPTMGELGVPPGARVGFDFGDGLFLIGGPRGSGRTTTLHAIVSDRLSSRPGHVLRILRSLDYDAFPAPGSVTTWRVGRECGCLLDGLRSAAEAPPPIIAVDDLATGEECMAALELAEQGVLVLAVVRAESVVQAYARFVEYGRTDDSAVLAQRFAEHLRGIYTQRLLPRVDGAGVVLAPELLLGTPLAFAVLRAGRANQVDSAIRGGRRQGMIALDDILLELVQRRVVDIAAAKHAAQNKQAFDSTGRRPSTHFPGAPGTGAPASPPSRPGL